MEHAGSANGEDECEMVDEEASGAKEKNKGDKKTNSKNKGNKNKINQSKRRKVSFAVTCTL